MKTFAFKQQNAEILIPSGPLGESPQMLSQSLFCICKNIQSAGTSSGKAIYLFTGIYPKL